ncbi:hypothetical protein [Methanolobus profundi]|uniref:Uncharacterized protein n=1 Tax=Methanolobus profundi TaxID=487685 RepID=A0A1I4PZE9_9EURY|nr:hypothetical protein [Methanolobus profundi]SFM33182.1 hypothetical protein SAMN04488696_1008 [Methanolobus profundi]
MRMDILLLGILSVVLMSAPIAAAEYNHDEVKNIIYEAGKERDPGFTEDLTWYVGDEDHSGVVGFWENGHLTPEMKIIDHWDVDDPMIMMTGEMTDQFGITTGYASFTAPTPGGEQVYVDIQGYDLPLSEIEPVADNIFIRLVERSAASGAISGSMNTIYTGSDIYNEVVEAIRDIRPGFTDDGYWYVGDDEHAGLVDYSELALKPEMKDPGYWDINERMIMSEDPDMIISSDIVFDAPTPYGTRVYVTVDGYNVPLSEIQPVAVVIYNTLVERSFESGAIGEDVTEDAVTQDDPTGTSLGDIESDSQQDTVSDDIPTVTDDETESTGLDDDSTDNDLEDELAEIDELFAKYDLLFEEGLIEYEGELDVEDIDKQDIEDIQNIQMNYILPEDFVESMEQEAVILDMLRDESSEDIDKLDEIDTSEEQDVEANKAIIKEVFRDGFNFEDGGAVTVGGGPDYEGKEKVAEKLSETPYLDAFDKTRKETMEKYKTGHEAASFFSDTYGDSKISKYFEKADKVNSIKEEVDKYVGAYKDTKKLSEMKGSSGTAAKALYGTVKVGQEVADKIPVVGSLIKTGLEVAEKTVMIMPELDDAIKNSDARQGVITNGPIGTSTPNAFLDSYGKMTQTQDGPSYSLPYTDENGEEHEISPDQWVKVTTKTGTYYVPTDEWENPIGDIALKDSGSSWKPWKWDNCQVVKRSNPKIAYNNGEEYDL